MELLSEKSISSYLLSEFELLLESFDIFSFVIVLFSSIVAFNFFFKFYIFNCL